MYVFTDVNPIFQHSFKSIFDAWIEFVQSQVFSNSSLSFSKYLINFVYGNFEKSSEDDIFKTTLVYFCFGKKCISTHLLSKDSSFQEFKNKPYFVYLSKVKNHGFLLPYFS